MFGKIGLKLTTAVTITTLVIIGCFATINIRSHRASLFAEVERHAIQISQTVKSGTEYDMLLNEPERIHEAVRRLGQQEGIERIRILNKAGAITYSSDAAEIGGSVDESAESCVQCHFTTPPLKRLEMKERTRIFRRPHDPSRMLGVITPIYNQPSCATASCHEHPASQTVLGVFDVVMPLAAVDAELRRSRVQIAVFALTAVAALSLILGVFVRRWVDVPVHRLAAATQHVAEGDLSRTIDEARRDELGALARAFNHMTRKLAEARVQLVQSDKLASLGRLAAGVAHEINNPLTGVLTFSSMLQKRAADRPELQEDLKVIVRETIRCRDIVKSLLDFARQSVPRKSPADLNEVVERALRVVERQLALNRITLVRALAPDLPRPVVDANQMEQVFVNLLVNAVDAIGQGGGAITVRSEGIELPAAGIAQIKHALCPKRHNLIDPEVRFDGRPALRFRARCDGEERLVQMDPVYGHGGHRRGNDWDAGRKVQYLCPECRASLMREAAGCPECGAPLFAFEVPSAGWVECCSRAGCPWQRWEHVEASGNRLFVQVQVTDTGGGIPAEVMNRIYEPFFSTKGARGTGLGLSVIWGILDNHDGNITVQSEVGRGTTFTVRIPVRA